MDQFFESGSILRGFTVMGGNTGNGILIEYAAVTIENNVITNNTGCGTGAGILVNFSTAVVRNNVITNNQEICFAEGAGIRVQGPGQVLGSAQIIGNTVTFNQSNGNGAGIALLNAGTPLVSGNTILSNTSTSGLGGGIYITGDTNPVISNNLVTGNQATAGSGLYSLVSNATVVNNTVANNAIFSQPSGTAPQVFVDGADTGVQFFNNILADRTGQGAVFCGNANGTVPSFSNNDVVSVDANAPGQPQAAAYTGSCSDMTGTNGNIQQDPLFVAALNGDYHLQPGSPVIDTGLTTAPNLPSLDLDGNARIATGDPIACAPIVDMGAYEFLAATNGVASLSPPSLSFGSMQIGVGPQITQSLTLSSAQGCVQVRSITATSDYQASSDCTALVSGNSCTIQVAFAPVRPGPRAGILTVDMGPATPALTATLAGEGMNAASIFPTSLSFGNIPLETTSSSQFLQVQNAGGVPMQVTGISITGDFSQFNSCSGTLFSGCFLLVSFTPTASGLRSGTLTITTSQGTFTVPLLGTGAAPVPVLTPSPVIFASQTAGSSSPAQTATLSNNGTADLFINSFNASGDFQVSPATCGFVLFSGASCTFNVVFTPSSIGLEAGTLQVDTNGGLATVQLSGMGTPALVSLVPQSIAFPAQSQSVSAPQNITVTNISGAPLPLISISAPDNFQATSSCPATLDTNASCVISVVFAPSSPDAASGFLSVGTDQGTVTAILSILHNTIRVPADAPSINAAVSMAQDGDTVLVAPGTYYEAINFQNKAITIAGAGGAAFTILDEGGFNSALFAFQEGPRSVLKGFTIKNASSTALLISGASPTIEDNIITANSGCNGGGILLSSSSSIIRNNVISNNTAPDFCSNGGGGILVSGQGQSGPAQIIGNTIVNNQALSFQNGGGGIAVLFGGSVVITNNVIQNNSTFGNGGGILVDNGSNADLVQNLVTGNSASIGGGIYHRTDFGQALLLNNTVGGNSALTGSALFVDGFDNAVSIMNNILAEENGAGAVACGLSGGQTPYFSFNDVFSAGQPTLAYNQACSDMTGINGNIKQDPQFVDLNSDYHLSGSSPAIDTGNPLIGAPFGPPAPPLDLDGKGRIGPGNAGSCTGIIDMGAYEFALSSTGMAAPLPPSWDFGQAAVAGFGPTFSFPLNAQGCVQVASIKVTGDFQQTNNCGNAVSFSGCTIQVTFMPVNSGHRTGTLTVDFGASSPAQTVALSGEGTGSSLIAGPWSLQFNDQLVGTSSLGQTASLFAYNFNIPLSINSVWTTGDFSSTNNCLLIGVIGPFCSVTVVFSPTTSGFRTGSVIINSNQGVLTIPLSGNGIGTPVPTLRTTSLDFPDQTVNTTSAPQEINLINTGDGFLQPQGFTITGDFSVTEAPGCQPGLNPGQRCAYTFLFAPTAAGLRTGTFTLQTNGGSVSLGLSGDSQ